MAGDNRHSEDLLSAEIPYLSSDEINILLRGVYGVEGELRTLTGERDQNLRVLTGDGADYVLKIANSAEDHAQLNCQMTVLEHALQKDPALQVPRPVRSRDGEMVVEYTSGGTTVLARLLTYLPGRPMHGLPTSPRFRRQLGRAAGRLLNALSGFDGRPNGEDFIWDIRNAGHLEGKLAHIADPDRRALAEQALNAFRSLAALRANRLPMQLIHNDINHNNILCSDSGDDIAGLIDFGDMVRSWRVNEIAIVIAHQLYGQPDPVGVACEILQGQADHVALSADEVAALPGLVAMRLATREIIAAWRRHQENRVIYRDDVSELGWKALEVWMALEDTTRDARLREAAGGAGAASGGDFDRLMARRDRALGPAYKSFYRTAFQPVRGEGVWVFDAAGKRYLDAYNNVPHVGHCHPHVVEQATKQLARFNSNTRYPSDLIITYAERLKETLPAELDTIMFVCTGTEANELAWRIAKANSGGSGAIVTRSAFHGNSTIIGALDTSTIPAERLEPWVATVPAPEFPGQDNDRAAPDAAAYAADYKSALAGLDARGHRPAAFFACPVFASDGLFSVPQGFLDPALDVLRSAGALIVADEVQSALARTGTDFWGFQHAGFVPDIVTMAKPLGNGLPLAAMATRRELVEGFLQTGRYFNTFGGNQVVAAAGIAVLDVIEREGLQKNALETGSHLRAELAGLMSRRSVIRDVRGTGLFTGVEICRRERDPEPDPDKARNVINALMQRGFLVGLTGPNGSLLKIRPPMVFDRSHADLLVTAIDEVLSEIG